MTPLSDGVVRTATSTGCIDELAAADPTLAELTRLQLAVDRHALVAVTDSSGVITHANDQFCNVSGYTREELVGKTHRIVNSGYHSKRFWAEMWQTISRGDVWHGDVCNRTKSGSIYWVDTTIVPFKNGRGEITQYVAVRSDITGREQMKQQLRELHQRLESIAAQVPGMVYQYLRRPDGSSCFPYASEGIQDVYRVAPEAVREDATPVFALLHPADHDAVIESIDVSARTLQPWRHEYRVKFPDGTVRWLYGDAKPTRLPDGGILWHGFITDITDQHAIREDIEQTRSQLQAVINASTHVAIISTDPTGLIRIFNTGAARMLGYTADEMVGKQTPTVIHLASEVLERGAELTRELGRPVAGFDVFVEYPRQGKHEEREWTYVRKDGSQLTVNLVVTPIQDAQGAISGFLGVAIDVSEHRRAREARAAEQRRLTAFVEHAPAAIAMFDRDLRYIAASGRWMIDYRLEGQQIIGRSHYDVFPRIPQRWKDIHARCLAGSVERNDDDVWQPTAGERRQHLRWEVRPWFITDDQIGGIIMFTEDITVLKETEAALNESRERFELAVRGSSDGIWDWNILTGDVYYSPRFKELLGYDDAEFPNHINSIKQHLHPEDLEIVCDGLDQHFHVGQPYDVILRLRAKSGDWLWFRSRGEAIRDADGTPWRMTGSLSDISGLKQAELDLAEQANVLALARDQAEAANLFKSAFVANVSHEIRTPMTAILGYVDLLADPHLTADLRASHIDTIKHAGQHLLTIINDILDLSKIEAGKLVVERIPMSPAELVRDVISFLESEARSRGLMLTAQFEGPIPQSILSDPVRVRQILVNLLGNALKFTPQGWVKLTVKLITTGPQTEPQLAFEIQDTGIGMTDAQMVELFQPFKQADASTTRKFGGTGLGLTICLHLTQLLGGDISVRSEPGRGSTFVATIAVGTAPLELVDSEVDILPSTAGDHLKPHIEEPLLGRILLVEDTLVNQRLIRHLLTGQGAMVDVADNGQLAVDMLLQQKPGCPDASAAHPYDLVLMDMQMPELDGYAATRILREHGYNAPIVALTAHAMADDRRACLEAGCNDHVTKPIDRERLFAVCRTYLNHAASEADRPTTLETPASQGIINLDKLFGIINGDLELLAELTQLFEDSSKELLDQGRSALARRDFEALRSVSHTMKGATGAFSGQRAYDMAYKLEKLCAAGHPHDEVDQTWHELERELADLKHALSQLTSPARCDLPATPP